MALDVQSIAQAQMAKFVLAQGSRQKSVRLVAELRDAFLYQRFVDRVIAIHKSGKVDTSHRYPVRRQLPESMSL